MKLVRMFAAAMVLCLLVSWSALAQTGKVTVTWGIADWGWMHENSWPEWVKSQFEKTHPDITIGIESLPNYWEKLPVMEAAGTVPDVFYIDGTSYFFPSHVDRGALFDLSGYVHRDFKDTDFQPGALSNFAHQGAVFGIPHGLTGSVIFYNSDVFDDSGIAYPSISWDRQQLVDQAKKLTVRSPDGTTQRFGVNFVHSVPGWDRGWWWEWAWQAGGELMSADETAFTFTDRRVADGMQFAVDLMWRHGVAPKPHELPGRTYTHLATGKAATVLAYENPLSALRQETKLLRWGVAPPVTGPAGPTFMLTGAGYGISRHTKHPDAAWAFLKWLTTKGIEPLIKTGFVKGAFRQQIPLFLGSVSDILPASQAALFYETQEYGRPLPMPLRKYWSVFQRAEQEALRPVYANSRPVETGLTMLQDIMTTVIAGK